MMCVFQPGIICIHLFSVDILEPPPPPSSSATDGRNSGRRTVPPCVCYSAVGEGGGEREKKIATGKGNADKTKMYEAFLKETKVPLKDIISPNKKEIGNPVSDLVDAFYICKFLYQSFKN